MDKHENVNESVEGIVAQLPYYEEDYSPFSGHDDTYLLEWSWAFDESLNSKELSQHLESAIPVRLAGKVKSSDNLDEMDLLGAVLDELPYSIALEGRGEDFVSYFLVPADTETSELVEDLQAACEEAVTDVKLNITIDSIEQLKLTDLAVALTQELGSRPHQVDILIAYLLAHHDWDVKNFADFAAADRVDFWNDQLLSLES